MCVQPILDSMVPYLILGMQFAHTTLVYAAAHLLLEMTASILISD